MSRPPGHPVGNLFDAHTSSKFWAKSQPNIILENGAPWWDNWPVGQPSGLGYWVISCNWSQWVHLPTPWGTEFFHLKGWSAQRFRDPFYLVNKRLPIICLRGANHRQKVNLSIHPQLNILAQIEGIIILNSSSLKLGKTNLDIMLQTNYKFQ